MTCIVGMIENEHIWLGADNGAYGEVEREVRNHPKVFQKGSMLIGSAGSLRIPQIIQYSMHQPAHPKGYNVMKYLVNVWVPALRTALVDNKVLPKDITDGDDDKVVPSSILLLGYRGELFTVEDDGNIGRFVTNYMSVGTGSGYALGALCQQAMLNDTRHPQTRVRDALEIAAAHVNNVRGPFTIISTVEAE
jgi:ATP-dependent protease HslVU (ClpYQ) peptidase subunit